MKRLMEVILPGIIGIMVHKREFLTQKELRAQDAFMKTLEITPRETKNPVVIAIIGLVGSGKTSVVRELAKLLPATIVEGDDIRVQLRKQSERYEGARKIAENAVLKVIKQGGNVILDSDHIDQKKRASLREKVKQAGAKLIFIRTHANYDVMAGRAIIAEYRPSKDDFFGGAGLKSKWQDSNPGAVVKLREMWRRTPNHYRWENKVGGRWVLKKLPFNVFVTVDTTDENEWKAEIQKVVKRILQF
ncbi:AAA family ATPase [Patescibacteria group bacterium]|nr:AAA family ATPase [Patescibacteria group bacterium]MBU1563974.1 AAA family ATPase [Patescibacteria group bacterium]MBU2068374.1 AAA family ATPase [Patescibacteria group bacterium]